MKQGTMLNQKTMEGIYNESIKFIFGNGGDYVGHFGNLQRSMYWS